MCEALNEVFREWCTDELEEAKEKAREEIREEFRKEANEKATQEGEHRVNTLNRRLLELGRNDDIIKATTDSEYQQQLFKEFGL